MRKDKIYKSNAKIIIKFGTFQKSKINRRYYKKIVRNTCFTTNLFDHIKLI